VIRAYAKYYPAVSRSTITKRYSIEIISLLIHLLMAGPVFREKVNLDESEAVLSHHISEANNIGH